MACLLAGSLVWGCASVPINDIHQIDFNNFTYATGEGKVTLRNGSYSRDDRKDPLEFKLLEVAYGDLMGDGHDEAVIVTWRNTGGTGDWRDGLLYDAARRTTAAIGHVCRR